MASVLTLDYLKAEAAEAAEGRRSDFDHFLGLVPSAPFVAGDETPRV